MFGRFRFGDDDDDSEWYKDLGMGLGLHTRKESGLNLDGPFIGGGRVLGTGASGTAKAKEGAGGGGGSEGNTFGDFGVGLDDNDIGLDMFTSGGAGGGDGGSFVRHALKTEHNLV